MEKYLRDIRIFAVWLGDRSLTGEEVAAWRDWLLEQGRAPATVNSILSVLNHFLKFLGHSSVNTTRIYLMTTGAEHVRQLKKPGLVA